MELGFLQFLKYTLALELPSATNHAQYAIIERDIEERYIEGHLVTFIIS